MKILTEKELRQERYVWFHFQYTNDEGDKLMEAEGVTRSGEIHVLDNEE
ncbi:MAG: hypothetical protein NXH70_02140 [Hyphomonas sp.]|nr:hypothetical protein [Hyphomonas sp.]